VNSHSVEVKPFQANPEDLGTLFEIISTANWLVIPLWFIVWGATAVMLSHYSKKFGRTKRSFKNGGRRIMTLQIPTNLTVNREMLIF
jgi:hypothetical protein